MRLALVLAVVAVVGAGIFGGASATLLNRHVPQRMMDATVEGREGNYTRSAANVIFNLFIDHVRSGNITAASALLADDATGMITGYACVELNKAEIAAVLQAFVGEVELLALVPRYHLVSERRGAFWVEDTAFTPPMPNGDWNFYLPHVLFTVELDESQTMIQRVVEYFPSAEQNATLMGTIQDLIAADVAKNSSKFAGAFAEDLAYVAYPQGQIYPPDVYNRTQLLAEIDQSMEVAKRNKFVPFNMYTTCNTVLVEWTQLFEAETTNYRMRTVNKRISAFHFDSQSSLIDTWTSYYWNEVQMHSN